MWSNAPQNATVHLTLKVSVQGWVISVGGDTDTQMEIFIDREDGMGAKRLTGIRAVKGTPQSVVVSNTAVMQPLSVMSRLAPEAMTYELMLGR